RARQPVRPEAGRARRPVREGPRPARGELRAAAHALLDHSRARGRGPLTSLADVGAVDLAALLLVAYQTIVGLFRGFVWQAVRLATVVAALVLARLFSPDLAVWLDRTFDVTDVAARALAWFAIGLGTFV